MSHRALIVLQARMGSTRLPGKVLADIAGEPLLAHCIRRLIAAAAGPIVVATTLLPEDDAVAREATRLGADVFRGDSDDVLARYVAASAHWRGKWVIRATADNPAVDIDSPRRVLQHLHAGADYVVEAGLPVGAAVEGVRTDALRAAGREADAAYDREHVTPFVRMRAARFAVRVPGAPPALTRPDLRFTVDTPADLAYMRRLAGAVQTAGGLAPLADFIAAADRITERAGTT